MSETIIEKHCPKCKKVKALADFYKNRTKPAGVQYWCKKCMDILHYKYIKTPHGKAVQDKHTHSVKFKATQMAYRQTATGKSNLTKSNAKYARNNPNKRKAKDAIHTQTRNGNMPLVTECQCTQCGKNAKQYHHYLGYEPEHWLDVIPLCRICHKALHSKQIA